MDSTSALRTTSVLGFTSSLFLSGIYFCSTEIGLPLLYNLPIATSTSGFSKLYYGGSKVVAPIVAISSISLGTAAYLNAQKRVQYASAAALVFSALPWTRTVMWGGIQRLLTISTDARLQEKVGVAEVEMLLTQWGRLNLCRAGFAAAAGIIGLLTEYGAL
jgi:hypothetical protein